LQKAQTNKQTHKAKLEHGHHVVDEAFLLAFKTCHRGEETKIQLKMMKIWPDIPRREQKIEREKTKS
jgi:hypothetical protein